MTIKAKVYVSEITDNGYSEITKMSGVTGGSAEDNSYAKATPCMTVQMTVDNPSAKGFFKPTKSYYVEFTEAP